MKTQILIQQDWGGAETLVSNKHPGEAASLCERARSTPGGEEGLHREGSVKSSTRIRDTNLLWVGRF